MGMLSEDCKWSLKRSGEFFISLMARMAALQTLIERPVTERSSPTNVQTKAATNDSSWPASERSPAASYQTSVCSAISSASSTSIPRYRTVLSSFVWPNSSWTARRFLVRR
jgi:hypothetical protein